MREALFSRLTSWFGSLEGLHVADLFAGSGALGLEALSRGAASVAFVDSDAHAIKRIRQSLDRLGGHAGARFLTQDARRLPPLDAPLDLLLLDPPYATPLLAETLARLPASGWVGPASLVSAESAATARPVTFAPAEIWSVAASHRYGRAAVTLLRLVEPAKA